MKRAIRNILRKWVPKLTSIFEKTGSKGKWFEQKYYTYLFTRSRHYSSFEPNKEESARWVHIQLLVAAALEIRGADRFERIIDFGCGRGWLSFALSSYGQVKGIEPIGKVVEYGKELYKDLDLVTGGIEKLAGECVDMIVCSEVLEHLGKQNIPLYVSRFFSSLEDGGFLIITTPRKEAYEDWRKYVELDQPTEDWLSEQEVLDFSIAAGFRKLKQLRYSDQPGEGDLQLEIYQQWLFQK